MGYNTIITLLFGANGYMVNESPWDYNTVIPLLFGANGDMANESPWVTTP